MSYNDNVDMHGEDMEDGEMEKLAIFRDDKEFEEFSKEEWSMLEENVQDMDLWDVAWDTCQQDSMAFIHFTNLIRTQLEKAGIDANLKI